VKDLDNANSSNKENNASSQGETSEQR